MLSFCRCGICRSGFLPFWGSTKKYFGVEKLLYSQMMHTDWSKVITRLKTANQMSLFQSAWLLCSEIFLRDQLLRLGHTLLVCAITSMALNPC